MLSSTNRLASPKSTYHALLSQPNFFFAFPRPKWEVCREGVKLTSRPPTAYEEPVDDVPSFCASSDRPTRSLCQQLYWRIWN